MARICTGASSPDYNRTSVGFKKSRSGWKNSVNIWFQVRGIYRTYYQLEVIQLDLKIKLTIGGKQLTWNWTFLLYLSFVNRLEKTTPLIGVIWLHSHCRTSLAHFSTTSGKELEICYLGFRYKPQTWHLVTCSSCLCVLDQWCGPLWINCYSLLCTLAGYSCLRHF